MTADSRSAPAAAPTDGVAASARDDRRGGPSGPSTPEVPARSGRADDVIAAARLIVERDGIGGLTMRSVADELQIKAPSLYKHVDGKGAIEVELIGVALAEMGAALHASLVSGDGSAPRSDTRRSANARSDGTGSARGDRVAVADLLSAYRRHALAHPNMYRLATTGTLPRQRLPAGLEDWAGEPFLIATGDPHRAQALWSFAHGMVVLELDGRFPDGSDLDRTWAEGVAVFARPPA